MRLMSVALTEQAVIDRIKTVTRRRGWKFIKPGDRIQLCRKVMGRKVDEPLVKLAVVEVTSVRREPLHAITPGDVIKEGFPQLNAAEFIVFFCKHMQVTADTEVTRIEWRYL